MKTIGQRGVKLLKQAGHDVATVVEQGLTSTSDENLIEVCRQEQRCLVSLDLDFSNPLRFRPSDYCGIAILRLPSRPEPDDLLDALKTLIGGFEREDISGKLWTVQKGRIRIYQED